IALDLVEQSDAAALHAEHADAVADLRPFEVEIIADEIFGKRPDVEDRFADMVPFGRAVPRQRHRAYQVHDAARKEAKMLGRFVATPGLGKAALLDRDHRIAADHPVAAAAHADVGRLGFGPSGRQPGLLTPCWRTD